MGALGGRVRLPDGSMAHAGRLELRKAYLGLEG